MSFSFTLYPELSSVRCFFFTTYLQCGSHLVYLHTHATSHHVAVCLSLPYFIQSYLLYTLLVLYYLSSVWKSPRVLTCSRNLSSSNCLFHPDLSSVRCFFFTTYAQCGIHLVYFRTHATSPHLTVNVFLFHTSFSAIFCILLLLHCRSSMCAMWKPPCVLSCSPNLSSHS
jgi:hypothetical protein